MIQTYAMHLYINFEYKNLSVPFKWITVSKIFWSHCRVVAVDKVGKEKETSEAMQFCRRVKIPKTLTLELTPSQSSA